MLQFIYNIFSGIYKIGKGISDYVMHKFNFIFKIVELDHKKEISLRNIVKRNKKSFKLNDEI